MIKHGQASNKYLSEQNIEQEELEKLYNTLDEKLLQDNTPETAAGTIVKSPNEWTTTTPIYVSTDDGKEIISSKKVSSVYAVATGDGETVPVPIGFYYVGGKIKDGVVISDNEADKYESSSIDKTSHDYAVKLKGNQFVWIPCKIEDYKKIDWRKRSI